MTAVGLSLLLLVGCINDSEGETSAGVSGVFSYDSRTIGTGADPTIPINERLVRQRKVGAIEASTATTVAPGEALSPSVTTTTDEQGRFTLPLTEGEWVIDIVMTQGANDGKLCRGAKNVSVRSGEVTEVGEVASLCSPED